MYNIKEILERNPIIPALKNDTYLEDAIKSSSEIVFVIMANILNLKEIVKDGRKNSICSCRYGRWTFKFK